MRAKVVIHVGLPKTATSFLQQRLFPKIKDVNFIRRVNFSMRIHSGKLNIISEEALSNFPYDSSMDDRETILFRLKKCYPDAKILVGIRERDGWLCSLYNQFVKEGYPHSYTQWMQDYNIGSFKQSDYINFIKYLFDDVFVYHFEKLLRDREDFVSNICNYLGVDVPVVDYSPVNISWCKRSIRLGRLINRYFKGQKNKEGGYIPEPRFSHITVLNLINKSKRMKDE